MNKETILTAKDLSKTFSNESVQQHVLKNLNLTIYKGDFTVIMGNSGSGKSTLLYALSGMDTPTLGSVFFGDKDIAKYTNDQLMFVIIILDVSKLPSMIPHVDGVHASISDFSENDFIASDMPAAI